MYGYGNSMFLATHGILARTASGGGIDPDAQAFITAASITDPTQQSAINTLVTDLKGYNIWTKMKALYPFVGGTAAQHKWNLKDPRDLDAAFRLVFSGGITHSSSGVDPNGVNGTADTKMTSASLGTSSLSMWYYSRENIGTNSLMGNANKLFFTPILTSNSNAYYALNSDFQGGTGTFIPSNFSGLLGLNRTGTTDFKAWRNGASYKTLATVTGAGTEVGNVTLFQRNVVGQYTANQCAFAALGDGLTDTEAANFYTAVQAFQTTLGRSIGTQTVSDADAQAFVTNAGIVDQVEANAVNNLVIGLKADSLWTKMKAVYPFVGGTAATHKFNLKNPLDTDAAFRLVFNGGYTHNSNGITGNGTNGFADTKFNPVSQSSNLNSFSISVYSRTNVAGNMFEIGNADSWANGVKATTIITRYANGNRYIAIGGSYTLNAETDSRGFYCGGTNGSATQILYKNGSNVLSGVSNQAGFSNGALYISAINDLNLGAQQYSSKNLAFASIGDGLSDTEATNLNTRVNTFQTALNRNV